jgi:hypothetical protein
MGFRITSLTFIWAKQGNADKNTAANKVIIYKENAILTRAVSGLYISDT